MTDHLEPYRRMVRSMRFVPPLGRTHLSDYHQLRKPVVPPLLDVKLPPVVTPVEPVVDPSKHISTLVREAVSKPTVLPVAYAIPENIGDRISKLAVPKPQTWTIVSPKIPQPDPNWTPTAVEPPREAYVEDRVETATVTAEPPHVEETAQTHLEIEAEITPTAAPVLAEKISNESLQVEAATPSAEPMAVEEILEETSAVEAQSPTVEVIPEELSEIEAETATAEETSEIEAKTFTAEPEEKAQQRTLLEKVSHQIEAVKDAIKKATHDFVESVVPEEPSLAEAQGDLDIAVEPTPSAEQESPKKETNQIICPKCESTEVRKNGYYKGKQRYACKDCSKSFVLADSAQNPTDMETLEINGSQLSDSVPAKSQKATKGKTNKKARGFGRSKS